MNPPSEPEREYDVLVAGGGAAGLNAALMLGRSRRSVLVVDAGQPRNAPADAVHGLLGHDGVPPAELLATGREEVRRYGGELTDGVVSDAERTDDGFRVHLADGRTVRARRLLLATGLVDVLPEIPGLAERWGRDLVHCPYCHGWEHRDEQIAVLGSTPMSVHQALLFSQWSDDVVYLPHEQPLPDSDQTAQLAARGVRVEPGLVTGLEVTDDRLSGVRLSADRPGSADRVLPRQAVAVASRMVARVDGFAGLGVKAVPHPSGMGDHVPVDPRGATDVPGVWAAGNVTDLAAQVGAAAAAGATAGAQLNMDLILADLP